MPDPEESLEVEPFIENPDPQFKNRMFNANEGIDFYIDAARFLPDNVTATKVVLRAFNSEL